MRRLARNSAILAKALSGTAIIVKGMAFDAPATGRMAKILDATKTSRGALFALDHAEPNLLKSGRNIPAIDMKLVGDLNAYEILRARHLVFTPEAFKALVADPVKAGHSAEA